MIRLLPTLSTALHVLQLLLICSCQLVLPLPSLRRNIIKVRASGFMPFESDLLLPLSILRQLQAQDRASRLLHHQPVRRKPKPKPKVKQQVRLERARMHKTDAGIQMYNLIDDDGELLLNLRIHNGDMQHNNKSNNNKLDESSASHETPWRPSQWRPTTTSAPLSVASSSPRPLPLHQYLSSNSLDMSTANMQQRRMFRARHDWNYNSPINH